MASRRTETSARAIHSPQRRNLRLAVPLVLLLLLPSARAHPEEAPPGPPAENAADSGKAEAFRSAMSEGLVALAQGKPIAARAFFETARKLRPNDSAAREGANQAQFAILESSIRARKKRAEAFEANEEWAKAAEEYRSALGADSRLIFARQGLLRSEERHRLLTEINRLLSDPDRLETRAVFEQARTLVQRGEAVAGEGTSTLQSAQELESLLKKVSTPISLTLVSDGRTEVLVYKVGNLGTFEKHSLSLRPGTYTLIGSRDGFRDERVEVRIRSGQSPEAITIIAKEPLR